MELPPVLVRIAETPPEKTFLRMFRYLQPHWDMGFIHLLGDPKIFV